MSYLKAMYEKKPFTTYPSQLTSYLVTRFGIKGYILDLGCGRGEYCDLFQKLGMKVEGVDIDTKALDYAKNWKVTIADFNERLPFSDETFDWVFAKHIIEHTEKSENIFKESYRILKKGGSLLSITQNWLYTHPVFYDDYTHRRPFTEESLELIYSAHNFQNIYIESFYELPFTWKHRYLKIVPFAIRKTFPFSKKKLIKYSKEIALLGIGRK